LPRAVAPGGSENAPASYFFVAMGKSSQLRHSSAATQIVL
jgi:hypothetical protein